MPRAMVGQIHFPLSTRLIQHRIHVTRRIVAYRKPGKHFDHAPGQFVRR